MPHRAPSRVVGRLLRCPGAQWRAYRRCFLQKMQKLIVTLQILVFNNDFDAMHCASRPDNLADSANGAMKNIATAVHFEYALPS
jgi:hypothetical protein